MANNPQKPLQKKPTASAVSSAYQQAPEQTIIHQGTQVFQGPVAHPEILKGYDSLVPGTAQRMIQLAEDESLHRRKLESDSMAANINAQSRQLDINDYQTRSVFRSDTIGQVFGLIVSVACILGSVYLGTHDNTSVAIALAALPTAAVIRAFFVKSPQANVDTKPKASK